MLSKGSTGTLKASRQPLGIELVAGAFVGMMAVSAPVCAQPGAAMGANGRGQPIQGSGFMPAYSPVGPVQPGPQASEDRHNRTRTSEGDRRLTPEEKWQLRQLLKTAQ
jgi:hypothetical protein